MATISKVGSTTTATIFGSTNDDFLVGGLADDIITGGASATIAYTAADGIDIFQGGAGDDLYIVNDTKDTVIEFANEGVDTIFSRVSYTLPDNVENMVSAGTTGVTLTGNNDNNILDGFQNTAVDTLKGMGGNDIYVIGTGDQIVEGKVSGAKYSDTGGIDTIETGAAINGTSVVDLSALITDDNQLPGADTPDQLVGAQFIENVTLTGTTALNIIGNAKNNTLVGNSAVNKIDGGLGNDTLDGGKNSGATTTTGGDEFTGGKGNDTFISRNDADTFVEDASEGIDTIIGAITTSGGTINFSENIENVTLTGALAMNVAPTSAASTLSIVNLIKGNNGANTLNAGAGNDTIYGLQGNDILIGGAGKDIMYGGKGSDTYSVDNTADVVNEVGSGTTLTSDDLVVSSVTYSLNTPAAAAVEKITLGTGTSSPVTTGTAPINATGNALDNTIVGNNGNNKLDGGVGKDSMTGNKGDDTYIVDNIADKTIEAASGGTDTVMSSVTFTAATEIEKLTLTGSGDINGTGNALDNTINGNSGDNILDGGAGIDTINGGAGDDTITGGADMDVVTTGAGQDTISFATGVTDTWGGSTSVADIDWYKDLSLTGSTGDLIDLTGVTSVSVGLAVSGAIDGSTFTSFIANMNTALASSTPGTGFNGKTAAVVTASTGSNGITAGDKFLAVDLDSNGFDAGDFVIEITGSSFTGLSATSFV